MLDELENLRSKVKALELENERLRDLTKNFSPTGKTVQVPEQFRPIFDAAEETVKSYFSQLIASPSSGRIDIEEERYVLLRASSLSFGFLKNIQKLYANKGEKEAFLIGKNLLFDLAHVLGLEDAKNFHKKMGLKDPISKLSAGPVHFAYSGWAFVDILPESSPTEDENYYIKYNHPYSFEADSWIREGVKSDFPVCIMNAGYSSGWCQESFGIELTAVEIKCRAKGDDNCTFVMAPPHKIHEYLPQTEESTGLKINYDVPLFFERKKVEEKLNNSLKEKEILIKEIHHRVKNNLQIISSLLNLQSNYIKDKASIDLFQETKNRIKTLALVHEKLYKSEDVEYVNLKNYVESIVELLGYSYDKEYIDIDLMIEDARFTKFDIEKAIPCGLIINEIVSNSFKHAFKKLKGLIKLHFHFRDEKCFLEICDDGIGISKDIDIKNLNSLGLELIDLLIDQLDGNYVIENDHGTKFAIEFPYKSI